MIDSSSQVIGCESDLRSNPVRCPRCGGRSSVYKTRGNRRNRKCPACGLRYVTQEVHQAEVDRLLGLVDQALEVLTENDHVNECGDVNES